MKKYFCVCIFLLCFSTALHPQETLHRAGQDDLRGKLAPKSLLNKISIHLENAPFEVALATLARKSNIKLNYSRSMMPLDMEVSLHEDNVYALEALLTILNRTGTMLKITQEGQLAIVPQKEPVPEKTVSEKGSLSGLVRDARSGDALPGANIYLDGTAIGGVSNLEGAFHIKQIPAGNYKLKIAFIGYKRKEIPLQILSGESKKLDITLDFDVVQGGTVVITAQAEGQVAAINRQLRSNTIKSVVASERIMELPDANAAESIGRLSGVSIQRSGGEGNRVVIRGLSPTYNAITINGDKIPATDLGDRSVDLNMISPEMLKGIELTKALTPDQDADAFGGIVNFQIADAPDGFRYNFRFQEGYNDQRDETGQYKGSVMLSNRFWENKFGIMITGSRERAQRGSDQLSAGYYVTREKRAGESLAPISVSSTDLEYVDEIRERSGFSVVMDYRLPNGKLMFTNFMSRLDRNEISNSNSYQLNNNWRDLELRNRISQIDVLTNSLSGEHHFNFAKVDWRLSRSSSLTRSPYNSFFRFRERSAFNQSLIPAENFGPETLIHAAYNDYSGMGSQTATFTTDRSFERDYTSQLNLEWPFTLTKKIAGNFKMGGKYTDKSKARDKNHLRRFLNAQYPEFAGYHTQYGTPGFEYKTVTGGFPSVANYLDAKFDAAHYLDGQYDFGQGLDADELNHLMKAFLLDSLLNGSSIEDLDDYETTEAVAAGYIMSELNLGRMLMILPGVRYEHTHTDMTGRKGWIADSETEPELDDPVVYDTTATNSYARWFPMMHVRFRPTGWFDVRLAYTKTLSRPRLDYLMPLKAVDGSAQTVEFGRPDLKPQTSANYDLFLSFYGNKLGLLTCGGFYKEIQDLIFMRTGHKILNAKKEGYTSDLQGLTLIQPENNPNLTKIKGWEAEWQTRFDWLPFPLNGLVLNINYTHLWSETRFPRSFVRQQKINVFPFVMTTVVDTFRIGKMPDQANDIMNVAIGYDKGPLSARLSMLHQGKTLARVGERPELDGYTADLMRWDLSANYRLSKHLKLFFNWNNITNEPDESFQQATRFLTNQEYYGWTTDIGIGYAF
jgi:TonB-dependent receptor